MIIRCWGSRGSIAVSGPAFVRYGGDTTCLEIRSQKDDIFIIDAGTGIRRLGNSLLRQGRYEYTMFFTHAHWDHILGFPFFKPVHRKETVINMYGCPMEQGNMQTLISKTMAGPYFPVPYDEIMAKINFHPSCFTDKPTSINGLEVRAIPLSHPNMGLGFKFMENNKSLVFLTDNELRHQHKGGRSFDEYVIFCKNADLLIHDAEFTDAEYQLTKGWGHSTYKHALDLAIAANVQQFGLFHHNQDRHDNDLDNIVAHCEKIISQKGSSLTCFAVSQDFSTEL